MAKPLSDILGSRGISLFAANVALGANLRIVAGRRDVAAPDDMIADQIGSQLILDPVIAYGNQHRFGHGYFLGEPKATEKVAFELERLCKA